MNSVLFGVILQSLFSYQNINLFGASRQDRGIFVDVLKNVLPFEPETFMDTEEVIKYNGFPCERHEVLTADGYYVTMFRIPHNGTDDPSKPRVPVLVQNFIPAFDSTAWVLNNRSQSYGFLLSDAGFDVWLLDHRGDSYSNKHVKYSHDSREYNSYSYDELGIYDLATSIDYILEITSQPKLILSSATQGTIPVIVLLSMKPEYNDKIITLVSYSPMTRLGRHNPFMILLRFMSPIMPQFTRFAKYLVGDFVPPSDLRTITFAIAGKYLTEVFDFTAWVITGGMKSDQFNKTRMPVYFTHTASSANALAFLQFTQNILEEKAKMYDFGNAKENRQHYGQDVAPDLPLEKIKIPILLTASATDLMVGQEEAELVCRRVQNCRVRTYSDPEWAHTHLCIALNGREVVFDYAIDFMKFQIKAQSLLK